MNPDGIGEQEIFNTLPAAIFRAVTGTATEITEISTPIQNITGYPPSFFTDQKNSLETIISPVDLSKRKEAVSMSIRDGTPYSIEYRVIHADGTECWICEQGRMADGNDDNRLITGIIVDVGRRKKEDQLHFMQGELYRQAFDSVPDLIAILDHGHHIMEMNRAMADRIGCDPITCKGASCFTQIHGTEDLPEFCPHTRSIIDKKVHSAEVEEPRMGGTFIVTTAPFFDEHENVEGCVHIAHDITEIKKLQEAFRKNAENLEYANQELEKTREELASFTTTLEWRVVEQTAELRALSEELLIRNRKIENLLMHKNLFINQLAHDLRTPLTPVIALLPLLKEKITDPDSLELIHLFETRIGYLRSMMEEVVRFAHLINQTSIDDYLEFDLRILIQEAFDVNAIPAEQKGIRLVNTVREGTKIRLSGSLAPYLFRNLIINAIQYNKAGGMVTVGAKVNAGWAIIPVTDTGKGIPGQVLDHMWDEFTTGDPARTNPQLKGLGLPIAKRIVTLHGGYLQASSQGEGKGAVFTLILPTEPEKSATGEETGVLSWKKPWPGQVPIRG